MVVSAVASVSTSGVLATFIFLNFSASDWATPVQVLDNLL